jgi:hypothetical protein
LWQNTGVQIQAGYTYTMSYYTGSNGANTTYGWMSGALTPTGGLGSTVGQAGYWGYSIGGQEITTAFTASTWVEGTQTLTVAGTDPLVGEYLTVLLRTNAASWDCFSDVKVTATAPVPEPTSLFALGSGMAALLGMVIRRRRS